MKATISGHFGEQQRSEFLDALHDTDKSLVGRGGVLVGGFWVRASDMGSAIESSAQAVDHAANSAGMELDLVAVHVASPRARRTEIYPGALSARSDSTMKEFTALVTCLGPESGAQPDSDVLTGVVAQLRGTDKWAQYPDASGRGHAIEFRFWVLADDAVEAALSAYTLVTDELAFTDLADWEPDRVHTVTVEERVVETLPGITVRSGKNDDWSVQVRVGASDDRGSADARILERLRQELFDLDPDVLGTGGRLVSRRPMQRGLELQANRRGLTGPKHSGQLWLLPLPSIRRLPQAAKAGPPGSSSK